LDKRVIILDVRMTENQFLEPSTIEWFLRTETESWDTPIRPSQDDIARFWDSLNNPKKLGAVLRSVDEQKWRRQVHGARVLEATIEQFTHGKLQYQKVSHGSRIARWLLAENPAALAPAREALRRALHVLGSPEPSHPRR
jgi:hypothetical protein